MPGVENVTLKNAGVSQTAFVGAAASSNLKWIHLPGNEVSSLEGLPIIESVVGLDLTGNPITDEGLARVAAVFPNLKHLNLRDTKITDNLVQQVAKVRWLTTLDLVGTKVTGKGLVALEVCPILNGIYVSKSQMTDEVRKHYDSKTDRRMQLWLPGDDPPAIKRE